VLTACEALEARGISPTVADARFAKPLDRDLILRLARDHEALITIEEGAVGGFGSHVAQLLAEEGVFDRRAEIPLDGAARHLHRPGQPRRHVRRGRAQRRGYRGEVLHRGERCCSRVSTDIVFTPWR
jgi:hypothetical protein